MISDSHLNYDLIAHSHFNYELNAYFWCNHDFITYYWYKHDFDCLLLVQSWLWLQTTSKTMTYCWLSWLWLLTIGKIRTWLLSVCTIMMLVFVYCKSIWYWTYKNILLGEQNNLKHWSFCFQRKAAYSQLTQTVQNNHLSHVKYVVTGPQGIIMVWLHVKVAR